LMNLHSKIERYAYKLLLRRFDIVCYIVDE
jgi:hypothetical protein